VAKGRRSICPAAHARLSLSLSLSLSLHRSVSPPPPPSNPSVVVVWAFTTATHIHHACISIRRRPYVNARLANGERAGLITKTQTNGGGGSWVLLRSGQSVPHGLHTDYEYILCSTRPVVRTYACEAIASWAPAADAGADDERVRTMAFGWISTHARCVQREICIPYKVSYTR